MRFNKFLFTILVAHLLLNFMIVVGNDGLRIEVGGSIDVHHHVWFTRHTIINGHIPGDQAFEYMPNALLIPSILSIVTDCNFMPLVILTRNIFSNIAYVIIMFALLSTNMKTIKISDRLLLLLLIVLPSSLGLMPQYLTVSVFPSLVITLLYVVSEHPRNIANHDWVILYLMLLISMLFSNFSYTIITLLLLIYSPLLIKKIYSRKKPHMRVFISLFNVKESLYDPLLITATFALVGLYLVYVIIDLRTSYFVAMSAFIERLANMLKGGGEITTIRTRVLSLSEIILAGFKIWGFLIIPYSLLVLISLMDLLKNRRQRDFVNPDNESINGMSLITIISAVIVGVAPWLGYDTLRVVNVLNLFIPLQYASVLKKLNKLNEAHVRAGCCRVSSKIFRLLILIVIIASYLALFVYALPQGYLTFNPTVPTKTFINDDNIELITIAEYFSPSSKFYVSIEPMSSLIPSDASIVCDRSICHSFMYLGRRDLYLQSISLSDTIALILNRYDQTVNISNIEIRTSPRNLIFVLICSEPGKIVTEEPVEYRSTMLRLWLMRGSTSLFYNSGVTCGFIW